jgi:hypothetical protein
MMQERDRRRAGAPTITQRDELAPFHSRPISLQRDPIVTDSGNLLDQVLTGRIIPAVNGVRMVGHAGHPD